MRSNLAGLAIGVVTLLALWPLYDWVTNLSQKQTDDSDDTSGTVSTAQDHWANTEAGAAVSGVRLSTVMSTTTPSSELPDGQCLASRATIA